MEHALIDWDDPDDPFGNTAHVAEHRLTPEEVESMLRDADDHDLSDSSGRLMARGMTHTGRFIIVPYDILCEDPLIVRPITAYEPDDPLE